MMRLDATEKKTKSQTLPNVLTHLSLSPDNSLPPCNTKIKTVSPKTHPGQWRLFDDMAFNPPNRSTLINKLPFAVSTLWS